ncbi:hypothetical protein Zmor_017927 [Zophobas morio]|uniref:Reverse transcriptase domain-containing protein n=1 Tax=Zophobas morio TaxID=2755281 RepID=A0AA38MD67_9CUCU|nr:hypothetical protein Zmor_017927 [Zophobas morio]
MPCTVNKCDDSIVKEDVHHPALLIIVNVFAGRSAVDMNSLKEVLNLVDWYFLSDCNDMNEAFSLFYSILYEIFDAVVLTYKFRKNVYPPWFSSQLIRMIEQKFKLWKEFKMHGNTLTYDKFKTIRKEIKSEVSRLYKVFMGNIEVNISKDCNKFWQFIKMKKKSTDIPGNMTYKNETITSPKSIVNYFADHFKSAYNSVKSDSKLSFDFDSLSCWSLDTVSEKNVTNAINKLKMKSTSGPDNVPSFVIRECADAFSEPLTVLFNLALRLNTFPDMWKSAVIIPVFKKGDRTVLENYRPVSLINNFSKIFEYLLSEYISYYLKHSISDYQHGFIAGRSTVTNLCSFTQFVATHLDLGLQIDTIFTDFSKAFDKMRHEVLIEKLGRLECSRDFLKIPLVANFAFVFIDITQKSLSLSQVCRKGPYWDRYF